jgi:hypothetical protein
MEYLDIVRYVSLGFNGLLLYMWYNRKFIQRNLLSGRWEGTLVCHRSRSGLEKKYFIDCILVVSGHKGGDCKALLYYEGRKGADNKINFGIDKLINYDSDRLFFWRKQWEPRFVRIVHQDKRPGLSGKGSLYYWKCKICNYWRLKEKMQITIEGDDIMFEGYLQKV